MDHLCEMGVDLNTVDQEGNGPLWVALRSRQENIAAKLVSKPASQGQELPLVQYSYIHYRTHSTLRSPFLPIRFSYKYGGAYN